MAEPDALVVTPTTSRSFTLDGRPATARPGELLISAAERAGTYIPRFCYHPRLEPGGMCRMCLVEVSGPRGPTLQPACFIAAAEGMEVVTTSDKVKKAQDGVLEFLLVNHPLDCPVCDKGGECPLQDQTLRFGPGETRFVEEKRHFEKPIAISDLVLLDRERCIQCARCTRFAEEVAGEAQIDFAGRGDQVEVATFPTEPFSSYFSGNTVQICPVGALTATPYRFTARPWDLDQVESTCTTCALGCRVAVQSSGNRLTRLLGIDSDPVNHGWLCDKGRFVIESVNGDEAAPGSATAALQRPAGQFAGEAAETDRPDPADRAHGAGRTASWCRPAGPRPSPLPPRVSPPPARSAGPRRSPSWAGPAAPTRTPTPGPSWPRGCSARTRSTPSWATACRPNWCCPCRGRRSTTRAPPKWSFCSPATSAKSCPFSSCACAGPLLDGTTALVELVPEPSSLTPYAAVSLPLRPGDAPAVARGAHRRRPPPIDALRSHPEGPAFAADQLEERSHPARPIGRGLGEGDGVVVVLGRPSLAEHEAVVAEAALVLAGALPGARFLVALRRGNVRGALDLGLAPGLLPGRVSLGRRTTRLVRCRALGFGADATAGRGAIGGAFVLADQAGPGAVRGPHRPRGRRDRRLPRPPTWPPGPRRGRADRGGGGRPPLVGHHRGGRRRAARRRWPTSAPAPPPTSRAASAAWARRSLLPGWPGPTG